MSETYLTDPPKRKKSDGNYEVIKPSGKSSSSPIDYKKALEIINKRKDKEMTPNSREQWLQNREAGDTSALENSYEDWKKL